MADRTLMEKYRLARLCNDSVTIVTIAERLANELQNLADFSNGEAVDMLDLDPFVSGELAERDYPSGADMVDYVGEMLTRLGITPTPDPT